MKKILLAIVTVLLSYPVYSAAADCIRLHDMEVSLLKQEYGKAHVSWSAEVTNECEKMVSLMVTLRMNNRSGASLNKSLQPVRYLSPRESRRIQKEEVIVPEIFNNIREYKFKVSIEKIFEGTGPEHKIRF